jgi:hypothetical protein
MTIIISTLASPPSTVRDQQVHGQAIVQAPLQIHGQAIRRLLSVFVVEVSTSHISCSAKCFPVALASTAAAGGGEDGDGIECRRDRLMAMASSRQRSCATLWILHCWEIVILIKKN